MQTIKNCFLCTARDLTDYSFFTQWPRLRAKHLLKFVCSRAELHFVIESEINQKQFRPGKHWNIISIFTRYAKMGEDE